VDPTDYFLEREGDSMAELQERETKLIQYLNEAYAKEQELVTALQAHISMTTRDAYKKRLKDHLKETKAQAKGLERRIKQLGGKAEKLDLPGPDTVSSAAGKAQSAAQKAVAAAKGPLHMIRGTGEAEKMLKNAKTEFWNEHDEIANYLSIEALADALGDKDTSKLAKEFRKQEERMAKFLEKTISGLTKEVVREEVPAAQRNGGSRRKSSRSSSSRSTSSRTSAARKAATTRASSSATKASSSKPSSSRAKAGTSTRAKSASTTRAKKASTSRAKAASTTRAKSASASRPKAASTSRPKTASKSRAKAGSTRAKASSSRSRASKS
jgi:ferritin-like metal-binding protein YciE